MGGWMDGWMVGRWVGGWVDGWVGGWVRDRGVEVVASVRVKIYLPQLCAS